MTDIVMWQPWHGKGFEILRLRQGADYVHADGVVLGVRDNQPFRMRYRVECDGDWVTRSVDATLLDAGASEVSLRRVADGKWIDGDGNRLPGLDGCIDIDFAVSPFTNTLPIRRLRLAEGRSQDIAVVYFSLPNLAVSQVHQRYTCKRALDAAGGVYLYEGIFRKFAADLPVDAEGIVTEYPQTWRRCAWPDLAG